MLRIRCNFRSTVRVAHCNSAAISSLESPSILQTATRRRSSSGKSSSNRWHSSATSAANSGVGSARESARWRLPRPRGRRPGGDRGGGIGVRLTLCTLLSFSAVVGPAIVQSVSLTPIRRSPPRPFSFFLPALVDGRHLWPVKLVQVPGAAIQTAGFGPTRRGFLPPIGL